MISTITGCVGSVIADILGHYANKNLQDIPEEYLDEMQGIYDGCKAVNPHTKVTFRDIVTLNVGVDVILAAMYTGLDLVKANPGLKPEHLKVPFMCNCFSVSKSAVEGDNHYMGRDFMFPAAGIFQETACMIIYKPDAEGALPIISVTAPGMVGSIAALNSSGVAVGVDISPSGWCNSKEPGFNSLLLSRQCIQYGADISKARDEIKKAKRGVSWIYILADGVNDRACIVETVMAADKDFDKEAPRSEMKKFDFTTGSTAKSSEESQRKAFLLWDKDDEAIRYIKDRYPGIGDSVIRNNGVKARWADEPYPASYLELNKKLFDIFDKTLEPGALEKEGFIDKYTPGTGIEKNTPFTFYFAPQREQNPDIVLATNHFVDPDMRYTVMNLWLGLMFADLTNDFQWRYDTLNSLLLEAVNNSENGITYDKAKELIDFLNPKGAYPWYYGKRAKVIQGSLSLMDLKAKTVESHYGYYSDEWIKLSLMKYL
ncbi:MAG: hypothetical protein GY950_29330 [bacterium]|nr:hypothetical protein [bacterium]